MNGTKKVESSLAAKLMEIGFSCTRCGDCCRAGSGDDNLVMVTPREIRAISGFCGLQAADIAEPYPESVELTCGRSVTFGRVLRRRPCGDCRFFSGSSCLAYPVRPSICRTYPFMLDGDELRVFPCRDWEIPSRRRKPCALPATLSGGAPKRKRKPGGSAPSSRAFPPVRGGSSSMRKG